jgi:hypothetical protein
MMAKYKRSKVILGILLALAMVSMGCGLTEQLSAGLSGDSAEPTSLPTRTPWPTFTPTTEIVAVVATEEVSGQDVPQDVPVVKLSELATTEIEPPDTPTAAPPADTPTPPPPTDTPPPPPTNTPAAPPAPPPTNTPAAPPAPPPTPEPQYQFTPGPWYAGDRNDAIVRFYGYLKDTSGTPVNGYSVRATCGDFAVLSFPSGPSPFAPDWAPGWYDIVMNPVTCNFTLQVVQYQCATAGFDAQCREFEPLSEAVAVSTDVAAGETIIVAAWVKTW